MSATKYSIHIQTESEHRLCDRPGTMADGKMTTAP